MPTPELRADATDDQDDLALEVPDMPSREVVSWEAYENGQGGWSFRPIY